MPDPCRIRIGKKYQVTTLPICGSEASEDRADAQTEIPEAEPVSTFWIIIENWKTLCYKCLVKVARSGLDDQEYGIIVQTNPLLVEFSGETDYVKPIRDLDILTLYYEQYVVHFKDGDGLCLCI